MSNYADDQGHHIGYNFDLISGHLHNSFPVKRNSESSDQDKKSKKRFVWPDDLHREFIAAVFDIGLNHASLESLYESLPQHQLIAPTQIKGILARLKMFRDRRDNNSINSSSRKSPTSSRSPRARGYNTNITEPRFNQDTKNESNENLSEPSLPFIQRTNSVDFYGNNNNETPSDGDQEKVQMASRHIRTELRNIRETIDAHVDYISNLRTSLQTQMRLYNQLVGTLTQLDPSTAKEFQSLSPADLTGTEATSGGTKQQVRRFSLSDLPDSYEPHDLHDVRQELKTMSSEMRSHMSLHRQLMMRREGQLLMHSGGNTTSTTARSSSTDNNKGNSIIEIRQNGRLHVGGSGYVGDSHDNLQPQVGSYAEMEEDKECAGVNQHSSTGGAAGEHCLGHFQSFDIDDELFSFLLEPSSSSNNNTNW